MLRTKRFGLCGIVIASLVWLGLAQSPLWAQQFRTTAGSQKSAHAFSKANWLFDNVQSTHYKHNKLPVEQQWQSADGVSGMDADCSGFVSYVINAVAPAQFKTVHDLQPDRPYPQSKTFATFFNSLSSSIPQEGWIKVSSIADLRQGDLIAWEKKQQAGSRGNTGHVMFVIDKPERIETIDGQKLVSINVLDSSSVVHFPPEQLPPNTHQDRRDGIGKGVVRLMLDGNNKPVGYWEGTFSGERKKQIDKPTLSDNIGFGRLVDTIK